MMFLGLRKLGNICCGHKMFLNKIRNNFCVPDTKFVSATNVALAGKRGNICVGNNVSATMCPRFPGPLSFFVWRLSLLPAHGANPRKIPRWTWKCFCKQVGLLKTNNWICEKWVFSVFLFKFYIWRFHGFHLMMLKFFQFDFWTSVEENLVVSDRVFITILMPWNDNNIKI